MFFYDFNINSINAYYPQVQSFSYPTALFKIQSLNRKILSYLLVYMNKKL
jgi:hypothetical protein